MSSEDQYLVFGSAQKRTGQEAEMITNTDDRPVVSDSFSSLSALFKHQTKVSTQYCSDISIFHSFFFLDNDEVCGNEGPTRTAAISYFIQGKTCP